MNELPPVLAKYRGLWHKGEPLPEYTGILLAVILVALVVYWQRRVPGVRSIGLVLICAGLATAAYRFFFA